MGSSDSLKLDFFVPGIPRPQGSKRAFVAGGRAIMTESSGDHHKAWRSLVTLRAHEECEACDWPGLERAVSVTLRFVFPRPKSHLGKGGDVRPSKPRHHVGRPDLSKLIRSVEDSLTDAGVWQGDSQVVRLQASKRYSKTGNAGVFITVEPWGEEIEQ